MFCWHRDPSRRPKYFPRGVCEHLHAKFSQYQENEAELRETMTGESLR